MKLLIFSCQDAKAGMFLQPFPAQNDMVALRQFSDACRNKDTNLAKHPEDYVLFRLGSFDDQTGKFENDNSPTMIGSASQYVEPK